MPPLNRWLESQPLDGRSTHSCIATAASDDVYDEAFKFSHRRRRTSVKFNDTIAQVDFIDHHCEWTQEERSARWHSQGDYACFRRDVFSTVYMLRNHPETVDDTETTARGIECRDPLAVERRQYVKQCAWNAVFEEQHVQRKNREEMSSPFDGEGEWIATLYSHAAKAALREALDFAALDQIAAINHQMEGKINDAQDEFNDDWISSISSLSPSASSLSSNEESSRAFDSDDEFGFAILGGAPGFDDSWITRDL